MEVEGLGVGGGKVETRLQKGYSKDNSKNFIVNGSE
jgi:hypothetical protein